MKYTFIIYLFTLMSLNLYSQTNEKLDNRNGFKDLKFGELISKKKKNLTPLRGTKDEFEYNSKVHNSLFGWNWEKCFVSYHENRLVSIGVFWEDNEDLYDSISRDLKKLFGKSKQESSNMSIKKQDGLEIEIWEGNNVTMILSKDSIGIEKPPCPNCYISLIMISNKLPNNEELENDF